MKNSIFTLAFLVCTTIIFSCCDDTDFTPGQFADAEKLLFESDVLYVQYQENEEEVKLIVEDILNLTNNLTDEFPALDFLSIKVDVNNNNQPDNNLDKSYGISGAGANCMQFVVEDGSASTGCVQEVGFSYSSSFQTSEKSAENHVIYELIFNKVTLFSESETIGLIFVLNGDDSGGAVPFLLSPLFAETIEFSL